MHTKKVNLSYITSSSKVSAAYMSGGLMLFLNLNDDTKFDVHVSSICFILQYVYEHFLVPTYYVDTKCINMLELRLVSVTLV